MAVSNKNGLLFDLKKVFPNNFYNKEELEVKGQKIYYQDKEIEDYQVLDILTIGEIKRTIIDMFKLDHTVPSFYCKVNKKIFKKNSDFQFAANELFQYILKNGMFEGRFITLSCLKQVVEDFLGTQNKIINWIDEGSPYYPTALIMEQVAEDFLDYLEAI